MTADTAPSPDQLTAVLYDLLALDTLEPLSDGTPITGLPGRWSPRPDGEPGARVELAPRERLLVDGVETGGVIDVAMSDPRAPRSDALALDAERRVVVWSFPDAYGGQVWVGVTTESADRLRDFRGVSTYQSDDRWRIPVSFVPAGEDERLATIERFHTGDTTAITRVGWFEATIEEERYRLAVDHNQGYAYVQFRDAGAGAESYAAGRAIRLAGDPADLDVLDFNDAVVPSCAFNPLINCPVPPRSNLIRSVVRAGQRDVLFASTAADDGDRSA